MSHTPEVEAMADRMIAEMRKEARDTAEAGFLVMGIHPGADDYEYLDIGITAGVTTCMAWLKANGMIAGVEPA